MSFYELLKKSATIGLLTRIVLNSVIVDRLKKTAAKINHDHFLRICQIPEFENQAILYVFCFLDAQSAH